MIETVANNLKLAIYARVSSEEQREGQTIDSQIAELERFAAERHWTVTGVYKDEAWSGALMARPELDHLRDDAAKGLFQAVLINDVDRLARDVSHLGVIKRDLEKKGVRVIFRKLPTESSPTHNLMVNILGSFAEFERELIIDRTRRGRRHKVEERKQYLGGNTSYGYRYIPKDPIAGKDGLLQIEPEQALIVQRMFDWVAAEGLSARAVLARLNELGVRPQKGTLWQKSSVLRILHNEMYAGVWHYNKSEGYEPKEGTASGYRRHLKCRVRSRPRQEWIPLTLPPHLCLISRQNWDAVQTQLRRNSTFSPRNEKHSYLLKGLIRCAGCGYRYVGDPDHHRYAYRCHHRCKKCPTVPEARLDDAVWSSVRDVILRPDLIIEQVLTRNEVQKTAAAAQTRHNQEIEAGLAQIANEENRLFEAYRQAAITPTQLRQQLDLLVSRRAALESDRRSQPSDVPVQNEAEIRVAITTFCQTAAENFDSFTLVEKQQFLRLVIREIIFDGSHARIKGCIPLSQSKPMRREAPSALTTSDGEIATTMIDHYGRNTPSYVDFQIETTVLMPVPGDSVARIAEQRSLI